jgi:hypothetical protein
MQIKLTPLSNMKRFLIFLFLLAVTWSCQDHMTDEASGNSSLSLEKAKEHYKDLLSQGSLESKRFGSFQKLDLLWSKTTQGTRDGVAYIEVPVMPEKGTVTLYKFSQKRLNSDPAETILKHVSFRLAFYQDTDGKIKERFLVYIADNDYLIRRKNEVVLNRIGKKQSDFNGYVEYSDRDGNVLSVERFAMGKLTRTYDPSTG